MMKTIVPATVKQKDNFKAAFAEIVSHNPQLKDSYSIQFFDTTAKSNYVFKSLDGKSLRIIELLTEPELELYHALKKSWLS